MDVEQSGQMKRCETRARGFEMSELLTDLMFGRAERLKAYIDSVAVAGRIQHLHT
jgi:hypothetical protein